MSYAHHLWRAAILGVFAAFLLSWLFLGRCSAQEGALALAYCSDREGLRRVSDAIVADGEDIPLMYLAALSDPAVRCTDAKLYNSPAVLVTLEESLWTVSPAAGVVVRFWRARLPDGSEVFTWSSEDGRAADQQGT